MIRYIEIKAPAKINIGLFVTEKRADGFHNLLTFFYPIPDLFDTIIIERSDKYELICPGSDLAADDSNLITKAKILLEKNFNVKINAKVTLHKKTPMGAGMGGGSSDAAAVLLAFNDMFGLNISKPELNQLALTLGSDVPYFLKPVPSIGKSRGEILTPVEYFIKKPIVIINPGIHINTGEAFRNITPAIPALSYELLLKKEDSDFGVLKSILKNDFENYVFLKYPEIKNIKTALYDAGAEFSLMTGTGSTVFGIFPDKTSAENSIKQFPSNYFKFISEN